MTPIASANRSELGRSSSGDGAAGIGRAYSGPGSGWWNEAESAKIGLPCWVAVTRRVVNERPSRTRSTL